MIIHIYAKVSNRNKKMKGLLILLWLISSNTYSEGFFNDITTIVGGHISDIKNRYQDDQMINGKVLASGFFNEQADGQDFAHNGKGSVTIEASKQKRYVQLGEDFYSSPGPDYHVYVSDGIDINNEADFFASEQIELGALIKGSGATYYLLPPNVSSNSVTIWCKQFKQYIASANIVYQ
ncbi:hypothetical protein SPBRAN_348 [uncultured Candidatus Thioglobus sp.]|nr:hypothetical protein SPBRAN_348 [uncultured Candidatus Thioglobus sp.]